MTLVGCNAPLLPSQQVPVLSSPLAWKHGSALASAAHTAPHSRQALPSTFWLSASVLSMCLHAASSSGQGPLSLPVFSGRPTPRLAHNGPSRNVC
jgi:hypothetical protein